MISCAYGELRGYGRWRIRREANANQHFGRDELARMTETLFEAQVRDAIERFPLYAGRVREHRGSLPGAGEAIVSAELPVWTRGDQRELFAQQERPADSAYVHQTSGSTSLPVTFHVTRESYEWRTAVTDRGYGWAGAEEGSRTFILWAGDQKKKSLSVRFKKAVHNTLQRRRFYDVFQRMGEEELAECCRTINDFRPHTLIGYTSMLVDLARYVRDHPKALAWKSPTLVNAAEGLQAGQREMFEELLVDEVYLAYGRREFMGVGMECSRHAGYHVYTDNVVAEVVGDDGIPVEPGENGRIVITDLRNPATPFIRYEIGDFGAMAPAGELCSCGLPFPLLTSVDGRLQDVVQSADGRKVTGLFVTFTMRQFDWIEGYQIVQDEPGSILVRLLSQVELTPERTLPVADLLRSKLGHDMEIEFEHAESLHRRASGKVALIISSIKTD